MIRILVVSGIVVTTAIIVTVSYFREHWCKRHRKFYYSDFCPVHLAKSVYAQELRDAVGEDTGVKWDWPINPRVAANAEDYEEDKDGHGWKRSR